MRFEELASDAGKTASEVGEHAVRPTFAHILERRRRHTLVTGLSAAAVVILAIFGGVLLSSRPGSESPAGARESSTTTASITTTTTNFGTTTTIAEEPVSPPVGVSRDECPITFPGDAPFTPATETPEGPPASYQAAWYGTPELRTFVYDNGQIWEGLPAAADGTLTQKTFWWSVDYVSSIETPEINVTAEYLNAGPTIETSDVGGGGNAELGIFMIAGLQFPHVGCWRVTAEYGDASVGYVAWVEGR